MSATIYQFPVGGRRIIGDRQNEAKAALSFIASRSAKTVLGNAWYHDEAIQEERTPKN